MRFKLIAALVLAAAGALVMAQTEPFNMENIQPGAIGSNCNIFANPGALIATDTGALTRCDPSTGKWIYLPLECSTIETTGAADFGGNVTLGAGTAADVSITFDLDADQTLIWDESEDAFAFSNDLDITGTCDVSSYLEVGTSTVDDNETYIQTEDTRFVVSAVTDPTPFTRVAFGPPGPGNTPYPGQIAVRTAAGGTDVEWTVTSDTQTFGTVAEDDSTFTFYGQFSATCNPTNCSYTGPVSFWTQGTLTANTTLTTTICDAPSTGCLSCAVCDITTVSNPNDAVQMSQNIAGTFNWIANSSSNPMDVYPPKGQDLGAGTNVGVEVGVNHVLACWQPSTNSWVCQNYVSSVTPLWTQVSFAIGSGGNNTGTFYFGGFYDHQAANDFNPQVTLGTSNGSYGSHVYFVVGTSPSVDTVIHVTGTTFADDGTRSGSQTEVVTIPTTAAQDDYYETTAKWIGQVGVEWQSGTNDSHAYGWAGYYDNNNRDFTLHGIDCSWLPDANPDETSGNIRIRHHTATGWTYNSGGATPPSVANMLQDYNPENDWISDETMRWKRTDFDTFVEGSGSEGIILEVTTTRVNAVRVGNCIVSLEAN